MQDNPSPNGFEQLSNWFSRSITVKLIVIVFLALILLIPASMVQEIIHEREYEQSNATDAISQEWAESQNVAGPVITIPVSVSNPDGSKQWGQFIHVLPKNLDVKGNVDPQTLHRGIYEAVVYRTQLNITAQFDTTSVKQMVNDIGGVADWDKAYIAVGISDLRGIEENLLVHINDTSIAAVAGISSESPIDHGVTVPIDRSTIGADGNMQISYVLNLQGSNLLEFLPLGSTTHVNISSKWTDPSFMGSFLPDHREVTKDGFTADWQILQLNRNYPQAWKNSDYHEVLETSVFGVTLMSGTDDYQKATRSVKYAILTIGLTFLLFFLTEIMNKKRIHPFQYILVGLALCLFYILLISLSEQMAFNNAYLISAGTIVAMITLYSRTVFTQWKLSGLLALILTALYTYLFVTIQISDYALLLGSVGLTIMLGVTMYATRKIKWYGNE